MKKQYIKPTTKTYNITPQKYAIGLPVTSEYDDNGRQAREYQQTNLFGEKQTSSSNVWEEW